MNKPSSYQFAGETTRFYFANSMAKLREIGDQAHSIIITDEHVYAAHSRRFRGWNCIVLKPGEEYKVQETASAIIDQLIDMEADRQTTLIGVGGGVITDLTGYVAAVYMRGIRFGFVPTSLLAMVDASIGGKNGVDVGVYKNLVGTIRQPDFLLHDMVFLNSLPETEWLNGFAEIIKHACIKDAAMFRELEQHTFRQYQRRKSFICDLVQRNARLKAKVVQADPFEQNERRLLNFGHTLGHALENQYELSHGQAVSIGMTYAAQISGRWAGFKEADRVVRLIERYGLPSYAEFDRKKLFSVLKMDKKRERSAIHYILLEKLGKGIIRKVPLAELESIIEQL